MAGAVAAIGAIVGAIKTAVTAAGVAGFLVKTAIGIGLQAGAAALARRRFGKDAKDTGLTLTVRNPIFPRRIPYGQTRLGGIYAFYATTGEANRFLHVVYIVGDGPIESFDAVYFDDEVVTFDSEGNAQGNFARFAKAKFHKGDESDETLLTCEVVDGNAEALPMFDAIEQVGKLVRWGDFEQANVSDAPYVTDDGAAQFDSGDFIETNGKSGLEGATAWSLVVTFSTQSVGVSEFPTIFHDGVSNTSYGVLVQMDEGEPKIFVRDSDGSTELVNKGKGSTIAAGQIATIALVYDGTDYKVYFDDDTVQTVNDPSHTFPDLTGSTGRLGLDQGDINDLDGKIYGIALFTSAISDANRTGLKTMLESLAYNVPKSRVTLRGNTLSNGDPVYFTADLALPSAIDGSFIIEDNDGGSFKIVDSSGQAVSLSGLLPYGTLNVIKPAVDGDLHNAVPSLWTQGMTLEGVAYVYLRLLYNQSIYRNGLPEVSFLIKGRNDITDPRGTTPWTGYNSYTPITDHAVSEAGGATWELHSAMELTNTLALTKHVLKFKLNDYDSDVQFSIGLNHVVPGLTEWQFERTIHFDGSTINIYHDTSLNAAYSTANPAKNDRFRIEYTKATGLLEVYVNDVLLHTDTTSNANLADGTTNYAAFAINDGDIDLIEVVADDNFEAYTNNQALVMRHYMTNRLGPEMNPDVIDFSSCVAQIAKGEETVDGEDRYTVNGVITLEDEPEENLRLLSQAGGTRSPIYSQGKWFFQLGDYQVPTFEITQDMLAGAIRHKSRQTLDTTAKIVKGVHISPENDYQPYSFPSRQWDHDLLKLLRQYGAVDFWDADIGVAGSGVSLTWDGAINSLQITSTDSGAATGTDAATGKQYIEVSAGPANYLTKASGLSNGTVIAVCQFPDDALTRLSSATAVVHLDGAVVGSKIDFGAGSFTTLLTDELLTMQAGINESGDERACKRGAIDSETLGTDLFVLGMRRNVVEVWLNNAAYDDQHTPASGEHTIPKDDNMEVRLGANDSGAASLKMRFYCFINFDRILTDDEMAAVMTLVNERWGTITPPISEGSDQQILDLELPLTASSAAAQRLGLIELNRANSQESLRLRCNLRAWQARAGYPVQVTIPRLDLAQREFLVEESALTTDDNGAFALDLTLSEYGAHIFDWNSTRDLLAATTPADLNQGTQRVSPIRVNDLVEYQPAAWYRWRTGLPPVQEDAADPDHLWTDQVTGIDASGNNAYLSLHDDWRSDIEVQGGSAGYLRSNRGQNPVFPIDNDWTIGFVFQTDTDFTNAVVLWEQGPDATDGSLRLFITASSGILRLEQYDTSSWATKLTIKTLAASTKYALTLYCTGTGAIRNFGAFINTDSQVTASAISYIDVPFAELIFGSAAASVTVGLNGFSIWEFVAFHHYDTTLADYIHNRMKMVQGAPPYIIHADSDTDGAEIELSVSTPLLEQPGGGSPWREDPGILNVVSAGGVMFLRGFYGGIAPSVLTTLGIHNDPSSISNLVNWYTPESIQVSAGVAEDWFDLGSGGDDLGTGVGEEPDYTDGGLNGQRTLSFDGTQWMSVAVPTIGGLSARTMFIVLKSSVASPSTKNIPIDLDGTASPSLGQGFALNFTSRLEALTNGGQIPFLNQVVDNAWNVVAMKYSGARSFLGAVAMYVNSFVRRIEGGSSNVLPAFASPSPLFVGKSPWISGSEFVGEIAEILIYDRWLTDSEMLKVHGYLLDKFNINVTSV